MIRVGYMVAHVGPRWLGGLNYFINLLNALQEIPDRRIEPVMIVGKFTDTSLFKDFPPTRFLTTRLYDRRSLPWTLRMAVLKSTKLDLLLRVFLMRHRIQVVSHSGWLHPRIGIPTIGWIPDFQHLHLPEFFSAQDIGERNDFMRNAGEYCTLLQLSSRDARSHLAAVQPRWAAKSRVVHFMAGPPTGFRFLAHAELEKKYGFAGKYIFLPGQFWIHKNHRVVVEALARIRKQGRKVLVLTTGNTSDHRQPEFFAALMEEVRQAGVGEMFRVLGMVSYGDVLNLLRHAVAMINPSRFEGWSTTVEEARSLGKRVLLSDIPSHLEQNLDRASYFGVSDAETLARLMLEVWDGFDPETDDAAFARAAAELPARRRAYGEAYQGVVMEALALGARRRPQED